MIAPAISLLIAASPLPLWCRTQGTVRLIDRLDSAGIAYQSGPLAIALVDLSGKVTKRVQFSTPREALYVDEDGDVVSVPADPVTISNRDKFSPTQFSFFAQRNAICGFMPKLTYFHPREPVSVLQFDGRAAFGISLDGNTIGTVADSGGTPTLTLRSRIDKRWTEPRVLLLRDSDGRQWWPWNHYSDLRFVSDGLAIFIAVREGPRSPKPKTGIDLTSIPLEDLKGAPLAPVCICAIDSTSGRITPLANLGAARQARDGR